MKRTLAFTLAAVIVLMTAAVTALPVSAGSSASGYVLPSEYMELEYVETDGNMVINTGIATTTTTCLEVTFQITDPYVDAGTGSVAGIMGAYWSGGKKAGRYQIGYGRTANLITLGLGLKAFYKENSTEATVIPKDTEKHNAVIDGMNGKCFFDGKEMFSYDTATIGLDETYLGTIIAIGAANYSSTKGEFDASSRSAEKIFYAKISNNNVVAGEFIPAYRVADKAACR